MTRGRKPKPAEVKRREGNPGKRALGDPIIVGERLIDPANLPPLPDTLALTDAIDAQGEDEPEYEAQRLWEETCALLIDANIIVQGDLITVELFVMAVLEMRRAFFEVRATGSTVVTQNARGGRAGIKANPEFKVWRESAAMVLKFGEKLGLSPVDRARLGLAVGKGKKIWEEFESKLPDNPVHRGGGEDDDTIDGVPLLPSEANTSGMDSAGTRTRKQSGKRSKPAAKDEA